jgi:hypothetical protein
MLKEEAEARQGDLKAIEHRGNELEAEKNRSIGADNNGFRTNC